MNLNAIKQRVPQLFQVDPNSEHTSLMIAFVPEPEDAAKIVAIPGVQTAADQLHVTLGMYGDVNALSDYMIAQVIVTVEGFARYGHPIEATLGGLGRFNGDGQDAVYASVDSPILSKIREAVVNELDYNGIKCDMTHGFTPHMTLAYVDSNAETPIQQFENIELTFKNIVVAVAGKWAYFKLGRREEEEMNRTMKMRDVAVWMLAEQVMNQIDRYNQEAVGDDYMAWHFLNDLYIDDNGQMYAVTVSAGSLFRWSMGLGSGTITLSQPQQVSIQFEQNQRTLRIQKRQDGRFEAFSVLGAATLNKDSEIDSRTLFDSFVERFKGDGSEHVNIYHIGGATTRIGELKAIFREGNLLIGYYVLDDNLVAQRVAETLMNDDKGEWGGSIEFYSDEGTDTIEEIAPGVQARVYYKGTLDGYSIAHTSHGAAWGTSHFVRRSTMDVKNVEVIRKLLGNDDAAVEMLQNWIDDANLRTTGAITRTTVTVETESGASLEVVAEAEEAQEEEVVDQTMVAAEDTGVPGTLDYQEVVVTDELMNAIVDRLAQSEWSMGMQAQFEAIGERINGIEQRISDLQASGSDPEAVDQLAAEVAQMREDVDKFGNLYNITAPQTKRVTVLKPPTAEKKEQTVLVNGKPAAPADLPPSARWKSTGLFDKGRKKK